MLDVYKCWQRFLCANLRPHSDDWCFLYAHWLNAIAQEFERHCYSSSQGMGALGCWRKHLEKPRVHSCTPDEANPPSRSCTYAQTKHIKRDALKNPSVYCIYVGWDPCMGFVWTTTIKPPYQTPTHPHRENPTNGFGVEKLGCFSGKYVVWRQVCSLCERANRFSCTYIPGKRNSRYLQRWAPKQLWDLWVRPKKKGHVSASPNGLSSKPNSWGILVGTSLPFFTAWRMRA